MFLQSMAVAFVACVPSNRKIREQDRAWDDTNFAG
jgi:hypothetical protein